ncbi:hypothetical protein [Xenorhabdus szentirmaii]|uniref:hypothetical protein n=1 Tax=Xenorhabdus szentirmaii TaxID=290112 RepID=UPI000C03D364|nr:MULTISPECIES: hypothetical protein [Xenorhabdus]MBD2804432.1 hypothetical protein [Xenorhabdus sp. ZM]MBD2825469.1 hypothetical protein [Xenorhabdus sp. 5]PHM43527.1 hypothetical protein Xszus_03320 [Xenorhabdus szentirmaii]
MYNYMKMLMLFLLSAYFIPYSLAQTPTPSPIQEQLNVILNFVVFGVDRDNRRYSAIRNYGTELLYQIPDDLYIFYTYDRQTYRVNVTPLVEEAARYWNRFLSVRGFQIRRAYTGGRSNFIIRTIPNTQAQHLRVGDSGIPLAFTAAPNSVGLAAGRTILPDILSEPGMYITENRDISPETRRRIGIIFGNNLDTSFADMTYSMILHEFGHALGLAHPEIAWGTRANNIPLQSGAYYDVFYRTRRFIIVRGNNDNVAPIMLSDQMDYLSLLRLLHRDRFITREDIVASPNETRLLARFLGDECSFSGIQARTVLTQAIPHHSRFVEEQSPDCSELRTVFPIGEMMTPVYQMVLSD